MRPGIRNYGYVHEVLAIVKKFSLISYEESCKTSNCRRVIKFVRISPIFLYTVTNMCYTLCSCSLLSDKCMLLMYIHIYVVMFFS